MANINFVHENRFSPLEHAFTLLESERQTKHYSNPNRSRQSPMSTTKTTTRSPVFIPSPMSTTETTTRSPVFIPDDLLTELLSLLPVKSLLRFKCVTNSWNTLISDHNFAKFHLNKSKSRIPYFTLITQHNKYIRWTSESGYLSDSDLEINYSIIPYSISSFLDKPSFTLSVDHCDLLSEKDCNGFAGFCNGLICLTGSRFFHDKQHKLTHEYWLRLWNPATRAISEKFGCFQDQDSGGFNFNFGCDNSTGTYKVIASRDCRDHDHLKSDVRVFSDNVWRHIENFPVVPLNCFVVSINNEPNAVFFNGTLNWLAIHNDTPYICYDMSEQERGWYYDLWEGYVERKKITTKQFVILSLDLGTETYNQYMLPQGFDEVPPAEPTISVLGDHLCFSYSYPETDLIIWQMKKFGDEKSWTQFLKISYHDLQLDYDFNTDTTLKYDFQFRPWFISKNCNTLIFSISSKKWEAILYNWRDQRVERAKVSVHKTIIDCTSDHLCWHFANSFAESLIPIC